MATKIARVKSMSPADIQARFQVANQRSRSNSRNRSTTVADSPKVHHRPTITSPLARHRTFTPVDRAMAANKRSMVGAGGRRRSRSHDDIMRDLAEHGLGVGAAGGDEAGSANDVEQRKLSFGSRLYLPKSSGVNRDAADDAQPANGAVMSLSVTGLTAQLPQQPSSSSLTHNNTTGGGNKLSVSAFNSIRPSPSTSRRFNSHNNSVVHNAFDLEAQKKLSHAFLESDRVAVLMSRKRILTRLQRELEDEAEAEEEEQRRKTTVASHFSVLSQQLGLKEKLRALLPDQCPDMSVHESFGHHASIVIVAFIAFSTFISCVTVIFMVFYL